MARNLLDACLFQKNGGVIVNMWHCYHVPAAVALSAVVLYPAQAEPPARPPAEGDVRLERAHSALHHHERAAAAGGAASALVLDNFELLGHSNLGGGVPNGDVFFYDHGAAVGKYAYVGTWSAQCTGQGAKIIDVNDPRRPRWIGYVGARSDSSNEDVVVRRIGSRDVLAIGVQPCGRRGSSGLALFDVTDPLRPRELAFFPTTFGVHELDVVVRPDGRALALLAVPFVEFAGEGEFQIVDVSDPTAPHAVARWSIFANSDLTIPAGNDEITSPFQGLGLFPVMFAHSVRAADAGMSAYVSYWDAGVVKVDISDPGHPRTVGRTLYPVTADGDAHSMTPYEVNGRRYVLQNDEDFDPVPSTARVTSSATGSAVYAGMQELWAPTRLADVGAVTGNVHDAGDGCESGDYVGAAGKVVLADTFDPFYFVQPCTIARQATNAAAAEALLFVSNLVSIDDPYLFGPDGDVSSTAGMPIVQIADIDELAQAIRAELPHGAVAITLEPNPPSWGYLRVFRETNATDWAEVGRFVGPATTAAPGFWSIHNTEVLADRAYSSWYSAGILALDVSSPSRPRRVGQFVPDTSRRHANALGVGPALVWGVAIDPETGLVYASEMRTGLWIVRPKGNAAASGP